MARFVLAALAVLVGMAVAAQAANSGKGPAGGHGPCITEFGNPGDSDEKCWTLVYADAEHGEPENPKQAKYGSNWAATAKAYPGAAKIAAQVKQGLADDGYTLSSGWTPKQPYTRLCVPSPLGLSSSKCKLRQGDFVVHVNPGAPSTDATALQFFKAFIRGGQVVTAGKTAH